MKHLPALAAAILFSLATSVSAASFTYRGHLEDAGAPAEGSYAFRLSLYADRNGLQALAAPIEMSEILVNRGSFAVGLDFPDAPAHAQTGWLKVEVKSPDDGAWWPLPDKQQVALKAQICPESWALAGNADTNPAVNFLGTTDDRPLVLRAGSQAGLRLGPFSVSAVAGEESMNIIAGHPANHAVEGVRIATIAGGGSINSLTSADEANRVLSDGGTVGGGALNTAGAPPEEASSAEFATVAGGKINEATERFSTVGGGTFNRAHGRASVVAGGEQNAASGIGSVVGGGVFNSATGSDSTVAGGAGNQALGVVSTVGGGIENEAGAQEATVSGGAGNRALGLGSAIGGGAVNVIFSELVNPDFGTIAGGFENLASNAFATIGGGFFNRASGFLSTVAGGDNNEASGNGSSVGGGEGNRASNTHASVAGGTGNSATGLASTVLGGSGNCAGGRYSWAGGLRAKVRPGSQSGQAGSGCNNIQSVGTLGDEGTFVWADGQGENFVSTGTNQFLVRAAGGEGINTNAPTDAFQIHSTTEANALRVVVGNTTRLRIYGTGGVGIGANMQNDPPLAGNLAVSSGIAINQRNPGSFRLAVNGDAAKPDGGLWSSLSDARLKHQIQTLPAGTLDRLLKLRGKSYHFTEEALATQAVLPGERVGFLAQEVADVFPDWVAEDDQGHLYITERGTTAHLVEALRELRGEKDEAIARLEAESAELRARQDQELADLRAELVQLRELLAPTLAAGGQ